jgi:large subunit ribosomal protein L6
MSRVGKKPIAVQAGVTVHVLADRIEFQGPKGKLASPLNEGITARVEGGTLTLSRRDDSKSQKALHGLNRALAANSLQGVTQGYQKQLEIVGVGYKAKLDKGVLELALGFSKPIAYPVPADVEIIVEKPTLLTVRGIDKQRVGKVADDIHRFRKPDPYKLKGVRYVGEKLIKKERKAGVSGA